MTKHFRANTEFVFLILYITEGCENRYLLTRPGSSGKMAFWGQGLGKLDNFLKWWSSNNLHRGGLKKKKLFRVGGLKDQRIQTIII